MESWQEIDEFPEYSVSDQGRVRNELNGNILVQSVNQQGVYNVALLEDGKQHRRSVALLVARAFLPIPPNEHFNTPINLNGDRSDNAVDNLMWRPRWFAIKYHKQFKDDYLPGYTKPIRDVDTGQEYPNGMAAAVAHGILDMEIVMANWNHTVVFPTGQRFVVIE